MNKGDIFAKYHLARYIQPRMLYHVISRTFQGRMLLAPDEKKMLNQIAYGVMAKALEQYPAIRLHNFAFLSNHAHWIISTECSEQFPRFMRYIKAEITHRWGAEIDWGGTLWEGSSYKSTALPTNIAHLESFKYVLAQGTKEGLIANPLDWPGPHGAQFWFKAEQPLTGFWLNGTEFSKAKNRAKQRPNTNSTPQKNDYWEEKTLTLLPLPQWEDLRFEERLEILKQIHLEIITDTAQSFPGRAFMSYREIIQTPRENISVLPNIPWHQRRATIVAWASSKVPSVQEYLQKFWAFQKAFRLAAKRHSSGERGVQFPDYAWTPTRFT